MLHRTGSGLIHYDLVGPEHGPVVFLIHSLTSDSGLWAEQVPPLLAAGYQVLRMDVRGHGGSSAPPGPYTTEMLAADAISLMDSLSIDRAHLVGLSMGGMIGQVMAADHPDRLASLMACCSASKWQGDETFIRGLMESVRKSGTLATVADVNMDMRFSPDYRTRAPRRWGALRATFMETSVDGYVHCLEAIMRHDVAAKLDSVRTPTLVLAGSEDRGMPPSVNKQVATQIRGARYVEILGGRHLPNVDFAPEFNSIMLGWLASSRP